MAEVAGGTAYDIAKIIRHESAFTIRAYAARGGNAASRWWRFADGSRLVICRGWQRAYNPQGFCILEGDIASKSFGKRP